MNDAVSIKSICEEHTSLSPVEIQTIIEVSNTLQYTADLSKANIFIDCLMKDNKHAIVVAEAAPTTTRPIYENPVVGKKAYETFEPGVYYCLRSGNAMTSNRAITQERTQVEQSVVPIHSSENRVIGALVMEKDISDQLKERAELKALSKTAESLSDVLLGVSEKQPMIPDLIEEAFFFVEEEGNLLYSNPAAINLVHGLTGKECKSGENLIHCLPFLEDIILHPDDLFVTEVEISNKIFKVKKILLSQHDKYNGKFIVLRDMTDLRDKEKELIMKSVAIQEIHHRVKNNLQTVASLLRLQMRRGIPEESKVYFLESLNRILSIASVYEVILSNSSIDEVDIYELIEKIGTMLVYMETSAETKVGISFEGINLTIESKRAVSVALVINELIQNCMNHAFRGRNSGKILVSFRHEEDYIKISVKDNGIGYIPHTKPSLGLEIVNMMVENDLAGEFQLQKVVQGTEASIAFPFKGMM
ncbi:sensor histidine kinase [Guptibacillus algicola]|uniref:sensor histidine kinase n=1 Tax=Guptibacillus algicola TaxID=225844 RepID=UPI001CD78B88|nr:sensor histidine kinase [Alkalihalobacillus algicola]MCA0988666.1 sensor histidine kinase [Alkalihalobacillus algicola]